MEIWLAVLLIILFAAISSIVSFYLGIAHRKNKAEMAIGSAEQEANRILTEAINSAETKKKEAIIEGKDEIHKFRIETEKELSERRKDLQRQERRFIQKEESLDRKLEHTEKKDEQLTSKLK